MNYSTKTNTLIKLENVSVLKYGKVKNNDLVISRDAIEFILPHGSSDFYLLRIKNYSDILDIEFYLITKDQYNIIVQEFML